MASSTPAPPGRPLSDAGHKRLSSFPSRQRRMGPAPLASFEDLSMDKTNSDHSSSSSDDQHKALSEIGEEEGGGLASSSLNAKEGLDVPTSPRIRVEAASSPSQHDDSESKESTPEKEHFSGYKKEEFQEEMSDLQHSTEELDSEEEKARKMRLKAKQQLMEAAERREEKLKLNEARKGSSSSVISDGLLPVTSGHSSRLSSLGSIGSPARRSPSPHKMLLETSFCGNKPIQHPSIDIEDPPISTADIMQYAIAKLETIKSPLDAKPPDIFRSTSPGLEKSVVKETMSAQTKPSVIYNAESKVTKVPEATLPIVKSEEPQNLQSMPPLTAKTDSTPAATSVAQAKPTKQPESTKPQVKSQEPTKSLQRRQEQQRRQLEHHEYYQRYVEQNETQDKKLHKDSSSLQNEENRQKEIKSEHLKLDTLPKASERQSRLEKRQTGTSPRSPRLGKKVPTPQVPELKDLPRTSPSSPASSATATTPDFHTARSSKSTTPGESPRSSKEVSMKEKTSDKDGSTPSLVRKGSFANIFRKSDSGLSPVTPDSPGSSGRKSPFSQFIKNAENKIRSRSRSRSRSKSRDRDNDDDTHDRRKVLSIFKPSKKKKRENGSESDKSEVTVEDQNSRDPINNVEFKFNSEGTYQSSSFGLIRQESEVSRAIKEPLRGDKMESERIPSSEPSVADDKPANDYSPYTNEAPKKKSIAENFSEEVTLSLRAREEELKKMEKSEDEMSKEESLKDSLSEKHPKEVSKKSSPSLKDRILGTNLQVQNDQEDSLSISESERGSEIEYFKKKEKPSTSLAHVESPDNENKGLVSQDSLEEDDLPFVPTTLPQERSIVPHIIPVKERVPKLKMTQSIDRPRSTTPIQPSRLEEYKQSSQELVDQEADKLLISIKVPQPGAVKVLPTRVPKRQGSKSWEDFCSEGLRSPRQLRRQYKEKQASIEISSSPPPPPPPPPPNWRSPTRDKARSLPETPRATATPPVAPRSAIATPPKWINFDEMPSIVLKPVRQIKTLPPKRRPSQQSLDSFEQKREFFSSQGKEPTPSHPQSSSTAKVEDSDKESEEHSSEESEDEKPASISSSEELSTVRETIEKLKQTSSEDTYENSDLERLLAPVNECISKLSSLASSAESQPAEQRRSPIPDNWEEFLLPPQPGRRSRLSSLGSDAGSIGMRSPSPSVMLLETSFCGNQPIDDPALAEPDVPIPIARKLSGISLGDLSPLTQRGERGSIHSAHYLTQPDRTSVMSDSSAEGGSLRGSDYDLSGNQRGQHGGQSHLNPFGMDLEMKSNRSSIISQDQSSPEASFFSSGHRT